MPSVSSRLVKKAAVLMTVEFCSLARVAGFAPGAREVRHTRPGLLSGYVLEGKLNLRRQASDDKAGDVFYVDAGKIHVGMNSTTAP